MTSATQAPSPKSQAPARGSIQSGQLKAIWTAATERGLDPHTLINGRSLKSLSFEEARLLLNRLNGRKDGYQWRKKKKPRKPETVHSMATEEQLDWIDRRYRIALGWQPADMMAHLKSRHYESDKSRTMDSILSSEDAQGVIEHLKIVLYRTLVFHSRRLRDAAPESASPAVKWAADFDPNETPKSEDVRQMMSRLPPTGAMSALRTLRDGDLRGRMGDAACERWLDDQVSRDGRILRHTAFATDVCELTYRMEAKLRTLQPRKGKLVSSPKPQVSGPKPAEEITYNIADYRRAAP